MPRPVGWRSTPWLRNVITGCWRTESSNPPPATRLFESDVDLAITSPFQRRWGDSRNDRDEGSANPVDRNHMRNWTCFALFRGGVIEMLAPSPSAIVWMRCWGNGANPRAFPIQSMAAFDI